LESGKQQAKVAHLVEHDLAKVGVAGSSPVFRSKSPSSFGGGIFFDQTALVVELVDNVPINIGMASNGRNDSRILDTIKSSYKII
jgi:hypothetical protein